MVTVLAIAAALASTVEGSTRPSRSVALRLTRVNRTKQAARLARGESERLTVVIPGHSIQRDRHVIRSPAKSYSQCGPAQNSETRFLRETGFLIGPEVDAAVQQQLERKLEEELQEDDNYFFQRSFLLAVPARRLFPALSVQPDRQF